MASKSEAALLLKLRGTNSPSLIWVQCFLQSAISAELLQKEHEKKSWVNGIFRGDTPACQALWNAYCALCDDASLCIREARKNGQLLFAHADTTVLQGGAA